MPDDDTQAIASSDFEVRSIAEGVTPTQHGYFQAGTVSKVSYPAEAHERCDAVAGASFWFGHRNRVILAAVEQFRPADGLLADVGGGNGYVAAALEAKGFSTVLIEPAAHAAANGVGRGLKRVICGDVTSARIRPASLGGVALFDVLEHIERDADFLALLLSRLRPGGRLYVTVPAYASLWSDVDVASGHFRRYRLRQLSRLVLEAGFVVDYRSYFFSMLAPPIFALRTLPSMLGRSHERTARRVKTEHAVNRHRAGAIAHAILAPEVAFIRRRWVIPFGTSCLLVAHRPFKANP